jgi:hypothetical protein
MSLAFNERTKLTASWLNTLATALIAAGAFAPWAALFYGLTTASVRIVDLVVPSAGCLAIGACLHSIALALLGRLRE